MAMDDSCCTQPPVFEVCHDDMHAIAGVANTHYVHHVAVHLFLDTFALSSTSRMASDSHSSPQRVRLLCGKRVVKMAAGLEHSLALTESGDMYSFGDNLRYATARC